MVLLVKQVASEVVDVERLRVVALYDAALIADQNVKLSVFTTRPAIYSPPFNWLCEFMWVVLQGEDGERGGLEAW